MFDVVHELPIQNLKPEAKVKPKRKIAIIGTAPQWQLAPFDDPTWEIWGIFGVVGCGKRIDRVYEVHDKSVIMPFIERAPEKKYFEFVNSLGDKFVSKDRYEQAPNGRIFDFQSKIDKYGPYFASSAAWLIAEAIDEGADTIGMWGINMASNEEYAHQKPSCTYMLGYAKAKGIEIVIPKTSELLAVSHQYGLQEAPAAIMSLLQKKTEITQQLNIHKQNFETSRMGVYGMEQALAVVDWFEKNWK